MLQVNIFFKKSKPLIQNMKYIFFFLFLLITSQTAFSQSFTLDFDLKKSYPDPYVFTDSSSLTTYFVFIRQETFVEKASICIVETDSSFRILRKSETECPKWHDEIVFQEINSKHLILYIADYQATYQPELIKLQIDRETLTYYFDRVANINFGDSYGYQRGLSDGKTHYIINLVHTAKSDSLIVLKIENGISKGLQRYLLPNLKDINETWRDIFKGNRAFRRPHPMLIINPRDVPKLALGVSENKLYLIENQLIFSIKCGDEVTYTERIIAIDCQKETVSKRDVFFPKPKALEHYSSNDPNATASLIFENYLFQAWTNGETGVLAVKTMDLLKEIRRWEYTTQDTFGFKNSPIMTNNGSFWFGEKKKPFKEGTELLGKMFNDGFLLNARKNGKIIELQFGTYKYVDESVKRVALAAGFGLIGTLIGTVSFQDYERATYFWMSLNHDDLSPQKGAILPHHFDIFCEKTAAIPNVYITNHFIVNDHRAILYRKEAESNIRRYYVKVAPN